VAVLAGLVPHSARQRGDGCACGRHAAHLQRAGGLADRRGRRRRHDPCLPTPLLALLLLGASAWRELAFVYLSAPDLALTQLLVEMVTIILMMLALYWLPAESPRERGRARLARDLLLSLVAGAGVAALSYSLLTSGFDSISPYFLRTAVAEGGGANVVNVILVDYRGYDTMGEITVLGIAGVVIYALLAGFVPARRPRPPSAEPRSQFLRWCAAAAADGGAVSACTCSCAGTTRRAAASSPAWCWRSR